MLRRINLLLATLALLFCLVPAAPALAAEDVFKTACNTAAAKRSPACQTKGTDPLGGNDGIIINAARLVAIITGIAAVITILFAGFMYVTAAGDANKAGNARKVILYAVVGLVVAALAQTILSFVIGRI